MFIACTIAALFVLWLTSGGPDKGLANQVDEIDQEIARIQQLEDEKQQLELQRSKLQRRLLIARETYQPISMTQVLARLSELTPDPIQYIDIELFNDRPEPEAIDDGSKPTRKRVVASKGSRTATPEPYDPNLMKISITGHAPSDEEIVTLIRRLGNDPVFTRVALRSSKVSKTDTHQVREFKLDVVIDMDRRFVSSSKEGGR